MIPTWTTACPDWKTRIVKGESLIPFAPLYPAEASAALGVLSAMRIADMPGQPLFGDVSRSWIKDFAAAIFGAYDPEAMRRRITEFFLLISKKNTKSTSAGLIMLTFLTLNWRQSGEFGILAPTVEVANNAFKPAADAIRADEELGAIFHIQDHIRTITHRTTRATLQVVAADSETVAGKKWIVTLVDELWLFGKRAGAEDMLREAVGGLASRQEGCVIWLSTQSNEPPAGVFKAKLDYARDVRDGKIEDPQFLPVIYEFPPAMLKDEAHLLPENFYITNPNLGASVDIPYLEREFRKAKTGAEEVLRGFLAKHLNVEIGLNLRADRWAGAEFWQACGTQVTLDNLLSRCEVIDVGIDGGGLDDLLGAAAVGREKDTGQWLHWAHAWAHPSVLERRKSEAPRLKDFAAAGELTLVDRAGDDVAELVAIIARIHASGLLDKIGVDQHGLGAIYEAILEAGIEEDCVVGISQGWKLQGAIKTVERKLSEGTFEHGTSSLMAWCVGNARVVQVGNAINITKQASGLAKIDPLMATFNAVTLLALNPEGRGRSFWDDAA